MSLGTQIANYRKKLGLTQEELARMLSVSNQAVSKWEQEQCCPDLMLLPGLADIFKISIDELFGRSTAAGEQISWEDDGKLRVLLFKGRTRLEDREARGRVELVWQGDVRDLHSDFSVCCDTVYGSVEAGGSVTCDNVMGCVTAGANVTCDRVGGNVSAGANVTCDDVGGNVRAGRCVNCEE